MRLLAPLKNLRVWQSPSVIVLVLANLIPLGGVWFFGWQVFPLMFLFWIENVMVGVINVFKIIMAGGRAVSPVVKFFLVPFFCFHYGLFTLVHGAFVFVLFGKDFGGGKGFFPVPGDWRDLVLQTQLGWAVLALGLSHGFSFIWNYVGRGEYRTASVALVMLQPYGRIIVLHLAILGGGFLVVSMGTPAAGLVLLVVLKIGLDLLAHVNQHAREANKVGATSAPTKQSNR
jgi:hypothetical protein